MLVVNRRIRVPLRELSFQFARSGGAGGQNVNKVNTKAMLRWSLEESGSVPVDVRERFVTRFRRRLTRDGELILVSQRFRDRSRNIADCYEKLRAMLLEVAQKATPRTPTKPGASARARRLRQKRAQGEKKQRRRRVQDDAG